MASSIIPLVRDVSSKSEEFRNTTLDSKVRTGMEEMRLAGKLCDVTLVVGNVDIQAHKVVLANTSKYFYSMFAEGLEEKESSRIVMEGLESEILTLLIEYSYSSRIIITQYNVTSLYSTSKTLQFWDVNKACNQFLINQIQSDNCFELKTFAKAQDNIDLASKCDSYILDHFGEIMKQEEFLKMDKEDLFTFLASDKIVLESEEQVFECILSWIDHDRTHRSGFFQDLMDYVRFSNISSGYLVTKILNEPLFNEFLNRQNENSTPSLGSLSSEPRQYLRSVMPVVMGGLDYNDGRRTGLWSVEGLDINTNTWSSLPGMPSKRYHCGAAVVGQKVYVMGGMERSGYSRSVCMYDPSENIWTDSIPSMREKRYMLGVAALNDKIYAVGGENMEAGCNGSSGKLNTVEVLDLTEGGTQEWRNIANMNTARSALAVGALNGKIFAVGGNDGYGTLKSVEAYDPEKNVWSPVADPNVTRSGAGVGVLDGVLYCVGGVSKKDSKVKNTVEKYCEDTNTWSLVAEMHHSRYNPGVVTHEGRLYVMGGIYKGSALSSVEMYDPQTNTWTLMANMAQGRTGHAVAMIHRPRNL